MHREPIFTLFHNFQNLPNPKPQKTYTPPTCTRRSALGSGVRGRPAREVAPLKRASDSATLFKRIFLKKELTSRPYIRYTIKLRVFAFISRFFSIRRSLKDGSKKGRAVVMYRFLYHWRTSYTSESFRRKAAGSRKA